MWGPWMSADFGIHRSDIMDDNISLEEFVAMLAAHKEMMSG